MSKLIQRCLCVICIVIGSGVSYAQWAQKKADLTLYSCEIVNEPLKKYISEQFLPVISKGVDNGRLKGYYIYMQIYKGNNGNSVDLVCEAGNSGMFDRNFIIGQFNNYKYGYYAVIDGVTIEIFCRKQSDFLKADFTKRKVVEYYTDVFPFTSDTSYEVKLEFAGDKVKNCEVVDFLDLIEPEEAGPVKERIYTMAQVEQPPRFPGGDEAMFKWISDNMNCPPEATVEGYKSRVMMRFCITETGEIENVRVVRSRKKIFEEEAIRLVKSMPPWEPGRHNGELVKVEYLLPISFHKK